jgi:hypothetical protein
MSLKECQDCRVRVPVATKECSNCSYSFYSRGTKSKPQSAHPDPPDDVRRTIVITIENMELVSCDYCHVLFHLPTDEKDIRELIAKNNSPAVQYTKICCRSCRIGGDTNRRLATAEASIVQLTKENNALTQQLDNLKLTLSQSEKLDKDSITALTTDICKSESLTHTKIINDLKESVRKDNAKIETIGDCFDGEMEGIKKKFAEITQSVTSLQDETSKMRLIFNSSEDPTHLDHSTLDPDQVPRKEVEGPRWSDMVKLGLNAGQRLDKLEKSLDKFPDPLNEMEERARRSCNLLVYGIEEMDVQETVDYICQRIQQLYNVILDGSIVLTFHRLGRPRPGFFRPILLKFRLPSYPALVMDSIKRNTPKGTKWPINFDKTPLQRDTERTLRLRLRELRDQGRQCRIRDGRIVMMKTQPQLTQNPADETHTVG